MAQEKPNISGPSEGDATRLQVRRPRPGSNLRTIALPPPLALPFDIVEVLEEERGGR